MKYRILGILDGLLDLAVAVLFTALELVNWFTRGWLFKKLNI